ncbi:MAG: thioredoxin-dependent thiol peroxidase [Micrococcales bacterium]|uniref:thioredoxin-dependent thiol peroxidase n=1 Tax=Kocuria palustris TaxID=71999 RepID=UPI00077B7EA1|nr:thioredoxin-dependent thiol peroxidase [Kocuria palustris]MDH5151345.1 thioredoxin-dependent thiol peroxidase [Kocuria palustris]MDN5574152.1 thioredoxin-dependent thiol peroxidase [Micrococcales bacterium]MDN5703014.1 thioredoxin-dependent thiol peroxidase [Micrococcales bacterium]
MSQRLTPGEQAPDFTLTDAAGEEVTLSGLRGRRVIVYFYPKASTPGCTTQACDFQDRLERLRVDGFEVLGISPDAPAALERFAQKESLGFPLLSDPDHEVAERWGAWGEKKNYGKVYEGLIRSTIVVDADGVVELAQYNVRAKGHVTKLRRDLGLED